MNEADYNITLFEACEILNKSKKTVSRYIRRGRLSPIQIKSQQGTPEYRFTKTDLDTLRAELARVDTPDRTDQTERTDETGHAGQTRQDTPPLEKANLSTKQEQTGQRRQDKTGQDRTDETGHENGVITLLKETTELLKGQLAIKDGQIGTLNDQVHKLIERDRETNILLKGLQDRLVLLDLPKHLAIEATDKTGRGRTGRETRLLLLAFILLLTLAVFFITYIMPLTRQSRGEIKRDAIAISLPSPKPPETTTIPQENKTPTTQETTTNATQQ